MEPFIITPVVALYPASRLFPLQGSKQLLTVHTVSNGSKDFALTTIIFDSEASREVTIPFYIGKMVYIYEDEKPYKDGAESSIYHLTKHQAVKGEVEGH